MLCDEIDIETQISELWSILKEKPRERGLNCSGLRRVKFSLNIEEFEKEYDQYMKYMEEGPNRTIVTTDISQAIQELKESSKIDYHHRSCRASKTTQNNSAICIHYYSKNKKSSSLVIPGLNYISQNIESLPIE